MPRNIDLWEYLPPFLRQFREMDEIMQAERPEFQALYDNTNTMRQNMFIQTAQDEGLSRYEKMLGIYPTENDTIDSRRGKVLTQWADTFPYTKKALISKIANIQGNNDVEVIYSNPYEITIITHLEKLGQVDNLAYLIRTIIPCNLLVISENILHFNAGESILYYGAAPSLTERMLLTNDLKETSVISGSITIGAGLSETTIMKR